METLENAMRDSMVVGVANICVSWQRDEPCLVPLRIL
jgi:hypothetical protein